MPSRLLPRAGKNRPRQAASSRPSLGWRFGFVAVTYAFVATMIGTTVPTPLYALYQQRFAFSELMITVIFATYAGGVIAGLLVFGPLSDEIGRRRTLLPGLVLSAAAAVAFLIAQGLPLLLIGRFLSGLSAGIFTGTATATLVDLVPADRREGATLIATMANMGGLGLGPLLAGILVQWLGLRLRLTYWVDLGLLLPAFIAVWLMADPKPANGRLRLRVQALTVPAQMRATFTRAALAGFAGFAVLGLFTAVVPAFLAAVLDHKSHALLGAVVFAVFLASTAGQVALGRVHEGVALPAGCVGLIVGMGMMAISLAISSLALLILGGVVAGLGQGLSFRAGLAAVNAEAPAERRGEVASSFFVVAYVAISIPVIGEGVLAQLIDLRVAGLVFTGVVAALAGVVLAMISGRQRRGDARV